MSKHDRKAKFKYDEGMQRRAHWLLITMVASLLLSAHVTAAATDGGYKGWQLEQDGKSTGQATVSVCKNGFKYVNHPGSYGMVSSPPKWELTMYNFQKKLYFPVSAAGSMTGRAAMFRAASIGALGDATWERTGSKTYLNHPAEIYTAKIGPGNVLEIWMGSEMWEPTCVTDFDHGVSGWPKVNRRLLRLIKHTGKEMIVQVDTKSIKPGTFSASDFVVPSGYKRANNPLEIGLEMGGIQDMIRDFGLGTDLGSGK